jgi:hypothetical protein
MIHLIIGDGGGGGGSPGYTAGEHNRAHWHPFTRAVRIDPGLTLCRQVIKRVQGQCSYSLLQRGHGWTETLKRWYVGLG